MALGHSRTRPEQHARPTMIAATRRMQIGMGGRVVSIRAAESDHGHSDAEFMRVETFTALPGQPMAEGAAQSNPNPAPSATSRGSRSPQG